MRYFESRVGNWRKTSCDKFRIQGNESQEGIKDWIKQDIALADEIRRKRREK